MYWTDPPDEGAPDVPVDVGPAPIPPLEDPATLAPPIDGGSITIQPELAIAPSGRVGLVWSGTTQTEELSIYLAVTDPEAQSFGPAIRVDSDLQGIKNEPAICARSDGSWVVVFSVDLKIEGTHLQVRVRRFANDGSAIDPTDIGVGTDIPGNHWMGDVACRNDGGFAITGVRPDIDGKSFGIFLRHYDAEGKPLGQAQTVNTEPEGQQIQPVVALADDGSSYVSWEDNRTGDYTQVLVRHMLPSPEESPAPTVVAGNELVPAVTPTLAAHPESGAYSVASAANDLSIALMWFATPTIEGYLLDIPLFKQHRNHLPALAHLERSDAMALMYHIAGNDADTVNLFVVGTGAQGDNIELATGSFGNYLPSVAYRAGVMVAAWTEKPQPDHLTIEVRRFGQKQ